MREITYADAIREALEEEMERDERVVLLGQGLTDFRGIYGTSLGLHEKFGRERVIETPLSEDAMTGVAVGMAMAGLHPVHTHIRADFLMLCMNQLINVAAKARWMWGGQVKVPLVVRAIIGKSWGQGAQHSQGIYPMLCHVPGLKVVAPTTSLDAKLCLKAAIRDDDPVLFFEHRLLHYEKGCVREDEPIAYARTRSNVLRADVTLVGVSWMAIECRRAQHLLAARGVNAEVVDPIWLKPLYLEAMQSSVERTRRLLVVENDWTFCGWGAEVLASLLEMGDVVRDGATCHRLGFAPTACPPSKPLETEFYPNAMKIARAAYKMVTGEEGDFDGEEAGMPIASTTRSF